MNDRVLGVIGSLQGSLVNKDTVVLTEKFVEGMKMYSYYWQGPIKVILSGGVDTSGNLDNRHYKISDLPFDIALINLNNFDDIKESISNVDILQGGSMHLLNGLAKYCRQQKIIYIHVSEYSLTTRWQIVKATAPNPIIRLRRYFWDWNQERKNKIEVKLAAGAQCTGTPVYEQYKNINNNALMYFDNRITEEMLADSKTLRPVPDQFNKKRPIRLAFSGRLNKMKGADALIRIAHILQQRQLPFEFHIFGDGDLEKEMRKNILRLGLDKNVTLHGVLDFTDELIPTLKENIDLFVCCHVQGDPSCTYIETFACAIPIIGYLNDAFDGLLNKHKLGWGVPIDDDIALSDQIELIISDPSLLILPRMTALQFATENTFHKVVEQRIKHMREAELSE
jgi:colanic acid/amylovoran biosynthesis glycosyltransferase